MFRCFSVKMTQKCAAQITQICSPQQVLRLEVGGGEGCGGFTYKFDLDSPQEDDILVRKDNATLVVDPASYQILDGSTIDYSQELIKQSFTVLDNPQAEMTCGCGTSFALKKTNN